MLKRLLVRVDATPEIGVGHVARTLALAQAARARGAAVRFVVAHLPQTWHSRLADFDVVPLHRAAATENDARETARLAHEWQADWIVVDGYEFDTGYDDIVRTSGARLLCIDDIGDRTESSDAVLNTTGSPLDYPHRGIHTNLLLGPRYALLRQEFWPLREPTACWQPRTKPGVGRRVLVTLGAGRLGKVLDRVMRALGSLDANRTDVTFIVADEVERQTVRAPDGVEVLGPQTEMLPWMQRADVAIASGGTTSWELAFLGVPQVLLVRAENQVRTAHVLNESGVGIDLARAAHIRPALLAKALYGLLEDPQRRAEMSYCARTAVDGWGVDRVLDVLERPGLQLRPADPQDSALVWEWANDPVTRAQSFDSNPIAWETHADWYERNWSSGRTCMFMALDIRHEPVGIVRVEAVEAGVEEGVEEGDAADIRDLEIHVNVAPDARQRGHGTRMIELALQEVWRTTPVHRVHARIKRDNTASLKAFTRAGFREAAAEAPAGPMHLVAHRNPGAVS